MSGNSRQRRKTERAYKRERTRRLKLLNRNYTPLSKKDELQSIIRIREDDIEQIKTNLMHYRTDMFALKCFALIIVIIIIDGNISMLKGNAELRFLIPLMTIFNIGSLCILSILFMLAYDKRKCRLAFQKSINEIKDQIFVLQNKLQTIKA